MARTILDSPRREPRRVQPSPLFGVTSDGMCKIACWVGLALAGIIFLTYVRDVKTGIPDHERVPELPSRWGCTPPEYGRTVAMSNVRVASGNTTHTGTFAPQILLCEPGTRIHLGNASKTENGARVIVRPLDNEIVCNEFYNMGVRSSCKASDHVIVSCEQSGCALFMGTRRCPLVSAAVDTTEFLFVAEWNAWYEL